MPNKFASIFFKSLKNRICWFFKGQAKQTKNKINREFERDVKKLYLLSFAIGAILGIIGSSLLLTYDGRSPINILDFLGVFLLFPLFIYIFLLITLTLGYFDNSLTANIKPYSKAISFGSTIFAIFGLIVLVYKSVTTDLVFGWATTIELTPESVYELLKYIAYPWKFLGNEFQPHLELVTHSQFYRTGESFLTGGGEDIESLKRLGVWWKFMSIAIITYGIIPRLLIFLGFTFLDAFKKTEKDTLIVTNEYALNLNLDNLQTYFSLEKKEISIYYSLLELVIEADLNSETETGQLELKQEWLAKWKDIALNAGLDDSFKFLSREDLIQALKKSSNPKAIKVMGDVLNFTPYHHLEKDEHIRIISFSIQSMKKAIKDICDESHINFEAVEYFKTSYGTFHNNDTFWKWAKVAIIAPQVGH